MPLTFFASKNGSTSCEYNKLALHSRYNPEREAESFVQNINCPFLPKAIIVTEPALSYCLEFLRKKFPKAIMCAVRLRADCDFSESDKLWDHVFRLNILNQGNSCNDKRFDVQLFADEIYNFLGEEILCATLSLAWQPSSKIFIEENSAAWNAIKMATEKAKTVLYTRGFFSARWIKNTVIFCKNVSNVLGIKKGNTPIVIVASGPSLEAAIDVLKKYREKYFLIAVSSAVSACAYYNIEPDFCITTDGGFWAKRHFDFCKKNMRLAMPAEAALPVSLYETAKIFPLAYGDGFADTLLEKCGFKPQKAERNGTVSGTAAMLAMSLTDADIFFCGLDMMPSPSFQHAQPNELELLNSMSDCRISTKETRISASRFASTKSLEIYRSWFSMLPENLSKRIFRVGVDKNNNPPLGKIKDIDVNFFEKAIMSSGEKLPELFSEKILYEKKQRAKIIKDLLSTECESENFKREFFPAEFVSMERTIDVSEKQKMSKLLDERCKKLCEKLERLV